MYAGDDKCWVLLLNTTIVASVTTRACLYRWFNNCIKIITMDAKIQTRVATLEDYAAVMALDANNTIYSGNDYLPAVYKSWINDPNKRMLAGVLDGKIVAFGLRNLIDDGQTLLGMSARVDVNKRDTGIWRQMRSVTEATSEPSSVVCMLSVQQLQQLQHRQRTRVDVTSDYRYRRLVMTRVRQMHQYNHVRIDSGNLAAFARTDGAVCRALTKPEALQALTNRENQWRLFPNQRIVCSVGLVPYGLLESNFRRIVEENIIVASMNLAGNECVSLSLATAIQAHNGFLYTLHYYGSHPANDVSDLVRHVMVHLTIAAKQQTKQPLQLRIMFSPLMPCDDVMQALKQVPGHEKCSMESTTLAVFELGVQSRSKRQNSMAKL